MNVGISSGACTATATQLVRDFPEVRRLSEYGPVHITSHGRTELVMLSPDRFAQMLGDIAPDAKRVENKLALVLGTIDTAVLIFDEDLCVRQANQAMCQLVDSDGESLIGVHASTLITHPSHRYTIDRLAEVYRSGYSEIITAVSARDDERTLQIRLKPWPNGVAMFADDITDRMRFGDLVTGNEMMDSALACLGGVGTAHIRSCGTILSISTGLMQMAGASPKSLIGARVQNLFTPQSRAIVNDALLDLSHEPRRYPIDYLRNGVTATPATMVMTSYWTAEHHACAAIALQDHGWNTA
jgi:hypothetical protein